MERSATHSLVGMSASGSDTYRTERSNGNPSTRNLGAKRSRGTSAHQLISSSAHQLISSSAHQLISSSAHQLISSSAKITFSSSSSTFRLGCFHTRHSAKPLAMLRGGLLALFLACPLWAYLRVPMETLQSRSILAYVRSAPGMGLEKHSLGWIAVASANMRCEQDTPKATRAEQVGTFLHPDPDVGSDALWQMKVDRQRQATTLEGCASQLHELQERVEFLELYVDELRKHIFYEQPISCQEPKFTPAQAQYLLEVMQKAIADQTPEEK